MQFRPCIDIHNGKVKQIIGSSLTDVENHADENYVASENADYYANIYKDNQLKGGHVILLNAKDSPYFEATKKQALLALQSFQGGLQIGGGINDRNAKEYLNAGASHVIVTSYVFQNGKICFDRLKRLNNIIGKDKIVLDVSCKKREDEYFLVTDRWQKETNIAINVDTLSILSEFCDEFLVHAVDVEGKASGIEEGIINRLAKWDENEITYAGGVHTFKDLEKLRKIGQNRIHVTIGSALDIFGGNMSFDQVLKYCLLEAGAEA